MDARELTDAECDAIFHSIPAALWQGPIFRGPVTTALIRAAYAAGCRAVLAAGVPRTDTAMDLHADVLNELRTMYDAAPREPVPEPVACWWARDDDSDTWATGCGNLFTINDSDTPSDAGMKFCLYCGKPVDDEAQR